MNITRKKLLSQHEQSHNTFSVLTYNILADCYAMCYRNDYQFVKDEHLLKIGRLDSKRHLLTMRELNHFNADVIMLQEVEDWYSPLLASELQKVGYGYIFLQKGCRKVDGCALSYKTDRFECINTVNFHISDEVLKVGMRDGSPKDTINKLCHPQVSLIVTLKDKRTGKVVIFATTHIICKLTDPAIQCLQTSLVCRKISETRLSMSSTLQIDPDDIDVVFGGDFNAKPDHLSMSVLKNGKLSESEMKILEKLTFTFSNGELIENELSDICEVCKYFSKYLESPLRFSSSYLDVRGTEPSITSSIGKFSGCLDYLFRTSGLKTVSVVDIDSSIEETYSAGGPTEQFASDHLPMVAEFSYREAARL